MVFYIYDHSMHIIHMFNSAEDMLVFVIFFTKLSSVYVLKVLYFSLNLKCRILKLSKVGKLGEG